METNSGLHILRRMIREAREIGAECVAESMLERGAATPAAGYNGNAAVESVVAMASVLSCLGAAADAADRAVRLEERRRYR